MGTMEVRLDRARRELERLEKNRVLQDPINYILDRRALLEDRRRRLVHGLGGVMAGERERFARLAAALDAMSPLKVLGRGYALAQTANGKVATSVDEVEPGGKDVYKRQGEMEQEAQEELILRRSWPSTWRVWKKNCPIHSRK